MAVQSNAAVGSGTLPFTTRILTPAQRGQEAEGRGERLGTNVVVINPEDILAVDAWAASGVVIGVAPVQVIAPEITDLPRIRRVVIQNDGGQDAYIAPTEAAATVADGFTIPASSALPPLELPLLHNNQIWARSASATTTLKIIVY